MLVNFGIPEEISKKHDIFITYEFGEDGTYKTYMTEESVNSLVNASFEYALIAYGVTAEQFPQVYGVSVEEIKDQLKAEIDLNDFVEEGKYRVENGVLYFSVEGVPEEAVNYLFDEGKLTLFVDGISIDLEKIAVNE